MVLSPHRLPHGECGVWGKAPRSCQRLETLNQGLETLNQGLENLNQGLENLNIETRVSALKKSMLRNDLAAERLEAAGRNSLPCLNRNISIGS